MTLTLRYAARSDRGLIRDGNQDSVYAGPRLLAVADGMGGMAAGDVASNIVIATLAPLDEDVASGDLTEALRRTVATANQQLRAAVEENPQLEGMGTTLTALLFSGSRFGLVHVGDSRAYLIRDGELSQITKDDTYVQMLVDEGRITAEEASSHPQRSLLTRAMDGRDVEPGYEIRDARPDDRYLLCSDGLSGVVSEETIGDTLREVSDPGKCVERLIQLALRGGGPDNVTVIIADVTDADIIEAQPIVGGAAARDRGLATAADPTSPAARAALAAPATGAGTAEPEPFDGEDEPTQPNNRRRLRRAVTVAVLIVLLGGGGWLGWIYTQSQYFVGATDDGHVAVFRGVRGDVAGIRLSSEEVRSPIVLNDLTQTARERVEQGIPADNRADALRLLEELTEDSPTNKNVKPRCQTASPSPTPSPTPPQASAGTTPRPPTPTTPAPATPKPTTTPSPNPSASTPNTERPSEDCRPSD